MLGVLVVGVVLGENLAGKVKHRQRARDTNSGTSSDDTQVPAREQTQPTKATSNLEKSADVVKPSNFSSGGDSRNIEVCSCDESEHHGQSKEGGDEEDVDTDSGDEEGERHQAHGNVVEGLR